MNKTALITGASSGLGAALLLKFKAAGYTVINVSRRECAEADVNILVDLTQANAAETVVNSLKTSNLTVDLLINNAGMGAYGTLEELSEAEMRKLFELNYFAPISLIKALLPELRRNGGGIINISSMAAKIHVPAMGGYCAVKAAFGLYSETLRVELQPSEIHVMTVYPGRINTGFSSRAIKYREVPNTPDNSNVSAADFAQKVYESWQKGRKRCCFPWYYLPGITLVKLFAEEYYNKVNLKLWQIR